MPLYIIQFLDPAENVRATAELECADDAEAIKEVHERAASGYCFGFDTWEAERLVYQQRRR